MGLYPEPVCDYLLGRYGRPAMTEPLLGLSHSRVWRIRFTRRNVIVKSKAHPNEVAFYRVAAPWLRLKGLPIPNLEWWGDFDDIYWLVLEDVPQPLPRARWRADSEILKVLHRLHELPLNSQIYLPQLFRPRWTATMTRNALACFPPHQATWIHSPLQIMRNKYKHLFRPHCYISGDPNPTNWGISENGMLMLYDWERFGLGTPAIDLAITIPGLGNMKTFREIATRYHKNCNHLSVENLTCDIAAAKVWSVVEFLSLLRKGKLVNVNFIQNVIQKFPSWLSRLDKVIQRS